MWSGLVTFTASPGSLRGATLLPRRVITRRQGLRGRTGPLPTEPKLQGYPCGMDQSMKKSDWLVGATSPGTPGPPPSRPPGAQPCCVLTLRS